MGIGKIDLGIAKKLANDVIRHVAPAMQRVEVAGSIRRGKSIVGDIELVGIPCQREKLIKLLDDVGQHIKPGVPGVIQWSPKATAKYLRLRLSEGVNLDFFLGTPHNFGGLFLMRTGSGAGPDGNAFNGFVPGIFKRFKTLSGGGRMTDVMPTMPTGEQLWIPEEQDFFDILEMNFVPPEERTGRNVIKKYVTTK